MHVCSKEIFFEFSDSTMSLAVSAEEFHGMCHLLMQL